MKKTLAPKQRPAWMERGELPSTDVRGVIKAARELRDKYRSPFGFCGPRLTANHANHAK